jgi:lipopolysaccharide biosynthesis glycosyltransferase
MEQNQEGNDDCPKVRQLSSLERYAKNMEHVPIKAAVGMLITSDSYVDVARVSIESYKRHMRRPVDFIALSISETPLSEESRCLLKQVGFRIIERKRIPNPKNNPKFRDHFTKLEFFNMTQYEKILFLDVDTVVLSNIDELYMVPGVFAAAMDYTVEGALNSGVMVLEPSTYVYDRLLRFLNRRSKYKDWGDQDYLTYFFTDSMFVLPSIYNVATYLSNFKHYGFPGRYACNFLPESKIIHYTWKKPWKFKSNSKENQLWNKINKEVKEKYPESLCKSNMLHNN